MKSPVSQQNVGPKIAPSTCSMIPKHSASWGVHHFLTTGKTRCLFPGWSSRSVRTPGGTRTVAWQTSSATKRSQVGRWSSRSPTAGRWRWPRLQANHNPKHACTVMRVGIFKFCLNRRQHRTITLLLSCWRLSQSHRPHFSFIDIVSNSMLLIVLQ